MKKIVAFVLCILFCFGTSPFVGAASTDELIINGDFKNGLAGWTITTPNTDAGLKTDESDPYVRILADETNTSAQLVSSTLHVEADTKYELSFYVRVPEGAEFDPSKASSPNFGIFEPSQKGVDGRTNSTYAEGQNNYAYSYASDYTLTRRTSFKSVWTVDGYDSVNINGYSNFGAKLHFNNAEGIGVSPIDAYNGWTKVTSVFTTVSDENNTAEADIAIGFVIKFPGGIIDIKNVSLKVWQEPPPSGPFVEADDNGIMGGYTTQNGLTYSATAYAGNEFSGWYSNDGQLISTEANITAKSSSDYYGARFKSSNPIIDSGFENYASGATVFDASLSGDQDWYVYNMTSATVINGADYSWVNTRISGTVAHTGRKSMYGTTYHQTVATPVKLEKNTKYALSFWYCYQTTDANCYVNTITYGIYTPNTAENKLAVAEGENMSGTSSSTKEFVPNQWKKASLYFTTGENTDDLLFCYRYADTNAAVEASINKTTLYVDDVVIMPYEKAEKSNVTVETKTAASLTFMGADDKNIVVGDTVEFNIVTEKGLTPEVTFNSKVLYSDNNGVYSFVAEKDSVIKVVCEGDENRRYSNLDKDGNDLTKYNRELYLKPIWEGNTVYHEAALFYSGRDAIKLLYPISDVVSVRSYDLKTNYINGVDYEITSDGLIKRLEGSRIPVYTLPLIGGVNAQGTNAAFPTADGQYLQFIGDTVYPAYALAITYEHTDTWKGDDGYNPYPIKSQTNIIPNVIKKLQNGEDVNIVIFGDSASCGWSSSGLNSVGEIYDDTNTEGNFKDYVINVAPYTPTWIDMFKAELIARYPHANITVKNLALGGKDSSWGRKYFEDRLKLLGEDWTTDLLVLCFAGNDATGKMNNQTYKANFQSMIDTLRNPEVQGGNPNAEVLLWSQNLPNTNAVTYVPEVFLGYEQQLESIAATNERVALVKLTSAYTEIIKSKEAVDYLNTNVNHGNDFLTRTIASALIAAMTPAVSSAGDVDLSGKVDLGDVVALAQVVAGWKNVTHDPNLLDTNGDKSIDLNDVIHLAQYVAGWENIELH